MIVRGTQLDVAAGELAATTLLDSVRDFVREQCEPSGRRGIVLTGGEVNMATDAVRARMDRARSLGGARIRMHADRLEIGPERMLELLANLVGQLLTAIARGRF